MVEEECGMVVNLRIIKELFKNDVLGPVLVPIYQSYSAGNFQPLSEHLSQYPIQDGDVVIGTMHDIEKAMYSVANEAADKVNSMKRAKGSRNKGGGNCSELDQNEIVHLETVAINCMELMWGSIRRRLGCELCGNRIAIVTDYQIVRREPERQTSGGAIVTGLKEFVEYWRNKSKNSHEDL